LAAGTIKSPYNWALSDWFNPPVIHTIERKDKFIRVEASYNVMVAKVRITILDAERRINCGRSLMMEILEDEELLMAYRLEKP